MKWYYFTYRSVTVAQQGEGILKKNGIPCWLLRTPRWMEAKGCGYCLRVRQRDWEHTRELLKNRDTTYSAIYLQEEDGNVREVQRAVSG